MELHEKSKLTVADEQQGGRRERERERASTKVGGWNSRREERGGGQCEDDANCRSKRGRTLKWLTRFGVLVQCKSRMEKVMVWFVLNAASIA